MLPCLVFQACKKDTPLKPSVDGSFAVKEVITTPMFYEYEVNDTDSLSTTGVLLEANEPETPEISYQWQIGTDPRVFKTKSVTLDFFSSNLNAVDVLLTVTKSNKGDTLKATTNRRAYLKRKSQVPGIYEGYFTNYSKKAVISILEDYCFPYYDYWAYPDYKGTLITSNIPYYDTIFISNNLHDHAILNSRFYVKEDFMYGVIPEINRNTYKHSGSIILSKDYNNISINLTARDVKTKQDITINFKGNRKK